MTQVLVNDFIWSELVTPDIKKTKDFYSKLFNWQFEGNKVNGTNYTLIKSNDKECGGIWHDQDNMKSYWFPYIKVADIKKTLEDAKQNGAQVVKEINQVEEIGLYAIVIDPSGAHLGLWEALNK